MSERSEQLPLSGISVLVTRAAEQSGGLVDRLTSRGADVTAIPAVSIVALPAPEEFDAIMDRIGLYENVVLTSVNGARITAQLLHGKGMGPWELPPALCVGEKTAGAWEEAGGEVAAVPGRFTAKALLEVLGGDLAGRSFLVMRPLVVKTDLGREMRDRGAEVDELIIYRTVTAGRGAKELRDLLAACKPDVIFFASPSAVEGILKMLGYRTQIADRSVLDIPVICIGPTTAEAAEGAGFTEIYFPDQHTARGMVEELLVISGKLGKGYPSRK